MTSTAPNAAACGAPNSEGENGADREPEDRPRQANVLHDDPLDLAAAAEQGVENGDRRQFYGTNAKRRQHQKRDSRT